MIFVVLLGDYDGAAVEGVSASLDGAKAIGLAARIANPARTGRAWRAEDTEQLSWSNGSDWVRIETHKVSP